MPVPGYTSHKFIGGITTMPETFYLTMKMVEDTKIQISTIPSVCTKPAEISRRADRPIRP